MALCMRNTFKGRESVLFSDFCKMLLVPTVGLSSVQRWILSVFNRQVAFYKIWLYGKMEEEKEIWAMA